MAKEIIDGMQIKNGKILLRYVDKDSKNPIVHIPEGITKITFAAFMDRPQIKEIYIPESITHIGFWAFFMSAFRPKGVRLYVYKDSYAHKWANEHNYPYHVINKV